MVAVNFLKTETILERHTQINGSVKFYKQIERQTIDNTLIVNFRCKFVTHSSVGPYASITYIYIPAGIINFNNLII